MKSAIVKRAAGNLMIILLILITVFHLFVLFGFIPYTIVWGGRLSSISQMRVFELVSLGINTLFLLIVLIRAGLIGKKIAARPISVFLWLMMGVFALNTLGNLLSENRLEKMLFTPLTLLMSVLCLLLALDEKKQ